MTKQEILDFFTENYGVAKPKKPRKGKKLGLIVRLIWLVTIIGPVLWFLNKSAWTKYDAEVARRAREYPALYEAEINRFLPNEKLFDKALKKTGFDETQVGAAAGTRDPIYFRGQDYSKKAMWRKYEDGTYLTSIQTYSAILFTVDQVVVYTFVQDFRNDTHKERTEEYFYKDITNVKTSDEEFTSPDGITQNVNKVVIAAAGGSLDICLYSLTDEVEESIQAMKQLIRQKKSV